MIRAAHSFTKAGAAVFVLFVASCAPTPGADKSVAGAVLGAGWGAGAGAIIGHQTGNIGPGTAIGAGFGAASGLLTGVGLDIAEGTELEQQREIDAMKVQIASNSRNLMMLQARLDNRDRRLDRTSISSQIFFDPDSAALRAGSVAELERLAEAIKENPYVAGVEVRGHTDETGDTERNERLSEARARTVATFLANYGVSLDRIKI
ncbi:MAG TPA: OmpA family protein, partial [Oligoflexia bacterium]|nr:OmpA family protein [Oligoflexia bacterium]